MSNKKISIATRASAALITVGLFVMTVLAVHPATANVGSTKSVEASVLGSIAPTPVPVVPTERPDPVRKRQTPKRRVRAARRRTGRHGAKAKSSPFAWPVKKNHITVPFGWRQRFDLKDGVVEKLPGLEFHHGIDIACAEDDPVRAARSGVVILSGTTPDYGNVIVIQHPGGWSTLYGHMDLRLLHTGQHVQRRQEIGLCGMTGRATGPHVHFEIRRNGVFFDPKRFLK